MGITVELDSCQGAFQVGIMDERGYGAYQDKKGIFHLKLSRDSQTILKLVAQTSAPSEEKVMVVHHENLLHKVERESRSLPGRESGKLYDKKYGNGLYPIWAAAVSFLVYNR